MSRVLGCGGRLAGIVRQHLTVARVAEGLRVSWNTANKAVLAESKRTLIDDPSRFDGVKVIGVDDSPARFASKREVPPFCWRHTHKGDKWVTVIIDLTSIRDGTGPSQLLDMVERRSKEVFKSWLAARPQAWHDAVEVIAMGGFIGFKTGSSHLRV